MMIILCFLLKMQMMCVLPSVYATHMQNSWHLTKKNVFFCAKESHTVALCMLPFAPAKRRDGKHHWFVLFVCSVVCVYVLLCYVIC